ncbi:MULTISPECIES: thioredoxin domain-containing protein [unclassified Curtobacterium]|uniref:DsbA family protein n=1 Tax=unclassified Curtobacterium TaxID=257496 RepID=UPI00104A894E|nr:MULTISPECIES: thioredoxin domain-containing protein [unclassified Curtobacterium]TCL78207.1 protein-disulfide isomerase [Curtobacterium sp. PhB128]TCL94932.1 protein-disulfide isomerase [Curtobacterium sp. PhB138]
MSENESKKVRRDAARERAREARVQEQARRRRNKTLGISGIIVGSLAVVAVVVLVIANSVQPAGPGPRNMASDGILFTGQSGEIVPVETKATPDGGTPTATEQDNSVANITVYSDYMCPYCNQFETAQMDQIEQWVKAGSATLELHPFNLLDRVSLGSKYSTRSAAAAACVANYDPDAFLAYNTSLYENQPSESTKGLTNDELASLAKDAGATNSKVTSCITGQHFAGWVADATNRVMNDPIPNSSLDKVTSTPTIIVNGKQFTGSLTDTDAFASFVEQNGGAA